MIQKREVALHLEPVSERESIRTIWMVTREYGNLAGADPLVPNAVFWQGECFFQMQDYANAVLTYQKVIEEHSKSNKYTAALLKQGISFFKLKKNQAGRLVLEDLIKKHPQSAEAKRAQAYLKDGN